MQDTKVHETRLFSNAQGDLVETTSEATASTVEFSAQGGGWVRSMPRAAFELHYKPAEIPGYTLVQVTGEWMPDGAKLPAYTNGLRWNGWAMPCFSFEAASQLIAHMPTLRYDEAADAFLITMEDYPDGEGDEQFSAQVINVDGAEVKVYAIGAGNWTWEAAD